MHSGQISSAIRTNSIESMGTKKLNLLLFQSVYFQLLIINAKVDTPTFCHYTYPLGTVRFLKSMDHSITASEAVSIHSNIEQAMPRGPMASDLLRFRVTLVGLWCH